MSLYNPTDADLQRLEVFAVAVGANALDVLGVWQNESGLDPRSYNANGGASGIFQVMPDILKGLGYRPELGDHNDVRAASYRSESFIEQLRWATRFYTPYRGKLTSKASFYVSTFLPADLDYASKGTSDTVLVAKGGRRGWAFNANAGFDANHDLTITVGELTQAIDRACANDRFRSISTRMAQLINVNPPIINNVQDFHLGTVLGIQQALFRLGFKVGAIDGVPGVLTSAALLSYQKSRGLVPDAIPGPATRLELQKDLDSLK